MGPIRNASLSLKHPLRYYITTADCQILNTLLKNWSQIKGYMNPTWSLAMKCIHKVLEDNITLDLVTSLWPAQPWLLTFLTYFFGSCRIKWIQIPLYQGRTFQCPSGARAPVVWNGNSTSAFRDFWKVVMLLALATASRSLDLLRLSERT